VSLDIAAGEMVCITGPSGAGKSTLLKLIAAVEKPTSGSVVVSGQNVARLRSRAVPYFRRVFGLIFQDQKLLYDRTAFDNVALPLQIQGYDSKDAAKRVRAALDKVGLLGRERALPVALSGGEQQRLCIARAIVHRPAILIADEPTGNLDAQHAIELATLFRSFNQVGVTVIVATHDVQLADALRPRHVRLEGGMLAAVDTRAVELAV
jgi:cell division transport system ATP-binding protein